jgi:hypothetical protein
MERSHSGLVRRTRNAVRSQGLRGFESQAKALGMSDPWSHPRGEVIEYIAWRQGNPEPPLPRILLPLRP